MKSIHAMCIRVGAKDLSSNSKQVSQPWEPISRLHFPQSKTMKSQRKTKKSTNSFQIVSSLTDSEESLGFVRQKRTVRLVTSHRETQQHSDDERCQYCTNLAQFNTHPRFLCFQNQSAKAVCKALLHDTNTSLID